MSSDNIFIESTFLSNAKINIGLNIFDKSNNGYHILESLIQEISISDIINIKILKSFGPIKLTLKGLAIDCSNDCEKLLLVVVPQAFA